MTRRVLPGRHLAALIALLAVACTGDSPTGSKPSQPARVEVLSGSGQTGAVKTALPAPLQVRVSDAAGAPAKGVTVTWTVTGGGGAVEPATSTTSEAGVAETRWTLGPAVGANSVSASVDGVSPAGFTATAVAGPVERVVLAPDSAAFASLGDTLRFRAALTDASGNAVTGQPVAWASLDTAVAGVDAAGLVRARGNGLGRVVASAGGRADTATVRVSQVVAGLSVSPLGVGIPKGDTLRVRATAVDARGNPAPAAALEWSSSDPGVATVDGNGLIRGVEVGNATVSVRSGTRTASLPVTVTTPPIPVGSVVVSPASFTLTAGTSRQLSASVLDAGGGVLSGRTVTWASSDNTVATVTSTGIVQAVREGTARISASSGGKTGTATVTVPAPLRFAQVAAGFSHSCALTPAGEAYCWGAASAGELGIGDPSTVQYFCTGSVCVPTPLPVSGGLTFTQITSGGEGSHTCALQADGTAYCWGYNYAGQLGRSSERCPGRSFECGLTPGAVATPLKFRAISAGGAHTCAIATDGALYCWGQGTSGQLGNGTRTRSTAPVRVSPGLTFVSVAAGTLHTCAVASDGATYCWGQNDARQLGVETSATTEVCVNSMPCSSTPVRVSGSVQLASVTAGSRHSCGLDAAGKAYCWGSDGSGALGNGYSAVTAPSPVLGGYTFRTIEAGPGNTCGVATSGAAYCWGNGVAGTLGNGGSSNASSPSAVSGGLTFTTLSVGSSHVCATTPQSVAYCWGRNDTSQLGVGTTATGALVPVRVAGQ